MAKITVKRASGERQTRLRRRSRLSDEGRLGGEAEVGEDALDDGGVREEREHASRAPAVLADQKVEAVGALHAPNRRKRRPGPNASSAHE